ncbi:MAG: response regulator [Polyangiales bacterium]
MAPRTVLICDDDEASRSLLRRRLERQGIACDVADSANEFRRALCDSTAVVLMDIELGDDDGRELVAKMKADPYRWTVAAVALTGYVTDDMITSIQISGFDAYQSKPVLGAIV